MWIDIKHKHPPENKEVLVYVQQGLYKFLLCAYIVVDNPNTNWSRKKWKQFGNYTISADKSIPFHHITHWHELPEKPEIEK